MKRRKTIPYALRNTLKFIDDNFTISNFFISPATRTKCRVTYIRVHILFVYGFHNEIMYVALYTYLQFRIRIADIIHTYENLAAKYEDAQRSSTIKSESVLICTYLLSKQGYTHRCISFIRNDNLYWKKV